MFHPLSLINLNYQLFKLGTIGILHGARKYRLLSRVTETS